jgi:uncharacterized protein
MNEDDIKRLLKPEAFRHSSSSIELVETHISWVILTGNYAYKIKKPVDFGFLDFSTLEKRKQYCEQEVGLNYRLAPAIYLRVVPVMDQAGKLMFGSESDASKHIIEYAVMMRQFPQSAQLDHRLENGKLLPEHMDAIAHMIAAFHDQIEVAGTSIEYGSADAVYGPVRENFAQIRQHLNTEQYSSSLLQVESWSEQMFNSFRTVFEQRKMDGFVRHCHGDMHLRNMLWLDDDTPGFDVSGPMAFDCIEFNPEFSWIDVISEVAFLVMDLQSRNQALLANRFLNAYLERTGDYDGLVLLDFYLCYRAMVRAKVAALRVEQEHSSEQQHQTLSEFESYLELATGYAVSSEPVLCIMHGLSASGKSTISQMLVDSLGMIRLRSDVERKRLFDRVHKDDAGNGINQGLYSEQASIRTYHHLQGVARSLIESGYSVIVDAAFLKHEQRRAFQQLAASLSVPFRIIHVSASHESLRQRIVARTNDVSDADLAVLEHQISQFQPFLADEQVNIISIDTEQPVTMKQISERVTGSFESD